MKSRKLINLMMLVLFLMVVSCFQHKKPIKKGEVDLKEINNPVAEKRDFTEILSKLKIKDTMEFLNLSNLNLKKLPDLSKYNIKRLDISHNELDTIPLRFLPKNLKKLICTNNNLKFFRLYNYVNKKNIYDNSELNLNEIDLSSNNLKSFNYTVRHERLHLSSCDLKRVNLSNNNLDYLSVNCDNVEYLNISNNNSLSNVFDFNISSIDTVLRSNIKNKLPLQMRKFSPVPIMD